MSFRIGTGNSPQLGSLRGPAGHRGKQQDSLEKLGSGHRVNRAADDAAALAVATEMGLALSGIEQGMANVYDGLSMVQTADGALESTTDQLQRMRELAVTAASDTLNPDQRQALQSEYQSLSEEIDRTAAATEFNGQQVLDGSAGEVEISLGQGSASEANITLDFSRSMDTDSLGLTGSSLAGADGSGAQAALASIDQALATVSSQRAEFGGAGNRLVDAIQGLAVAAENTYAARSRLIDTDYARRTAELTRQQIMAQAGYAATVQGQKLPSSVLNLLA